MNGHLAEACGLVFLVIVLSLVEYLWTKGIYFKNVEKRQDFPDTL